MAFNGLFCHTVIYFITSFYTQDLKKDLKIFLKCLSVNREFILLLGFLVKSPKVGDCFDPSVPPQI